MEGYGPETYGERIAEVYDDLFHPPTSSMETVEFLARLAADGPMLELAIGTGRIALPLAAEGIEVHGIDASEAMVAKLRAKPGGNDIPVTIGDFADVEVEGRYRVIAIVFNTLWALLTQADQARCVRNVAAHLTQDGAFVTEMYVPDPARFDRGQRVHVRNIESRRVVLETSLYDPANQRVSGQLIALEDGGRDLHVPGRAPLHLAVRARPHGRARWPSAARTLGRMETRTIRCHRMVHLGVRAGGSLSGRTGHVTCGPKAALVAPPRGPPGSG